MTPAPQCVGEDEALVVAARLMRDLDVGALPVCTVDRKLKGMVTDRDIVVKCVADGGDPSAVTAGLLAESAPVTVQADDDVQDVLEAMMSNRIRRIPVIEGYDLVGIISQADMTRAARPDSPRGNVPHMGTLYYGARDMPIHIEDRALAHLKVVIATKLRRNESFTLSWEHRDGESPGRSTIWLHPSIPLLFVFDDPEAPELSRTWIEELAKSANTSGGILLVEEHREDPGEDT